MDSDQKKYLNNVFSEEVEFNSTEQYMMYQKAIIFFDIETAEKILNISNAREINELGQSVRPFDEEVWRFFRSEIFYEANRLKFSQNNSMLFALADTFGTTLVEVSSYDEIFGVGLAEGSPMLS